MLTAKEQITQHAEATAVRLAEELTDLLARVRADWFENDRAADLAANEEERVSKVNYLLNDHENHLAAAVICAVGFVCARFDASAVPEVRTERIDRTVKLIVSIRDTWVATITVMDTGGPAACLSRETVVGGLTFEFAGDLAARFMCADPDHKTKETNT